MTSPQVGLLKSGFLPATYTPFHVDTTVGADTLSLDEAGRKEFMRRWELLKTFDERLRNDPSLAAKAYRDYNNHYEGAVSMMSDARAAQVFAIDPPIMNATASRSSATALVVARNLVEGGRRHPLRHRQPRRSGIITAAFTVRATTTRCRGIDAALAGLLDDLVARKRADGQPLLDETLVVCFGEFGRTPGELNPAPGRDHYQYA